MSHSVPRGMDVMHQPCQTSQALRARDILLQCVALAGPSFLAAFKQQLCWFIRKGQFHTPNAGLWTEPVQCFKII